MKTIYNIAKNELRQLFYSPIAWILLVIFFVQCGMAFSEVMSVLIRVKALGQGLASVTSQIFNDNWNGVYPEILGYLFIYIPLLTMSIMSREKTEGTDRLLLSSPVTAFQIVSGKFLSMAIYGIVMLSGLLLQILFCCVVVKDIDAGPAFSGLLGLYLLLLAYAAAGIFMSSLTRYQIIAAVGTIAVLFGLNYMPAVGQGIPVIRDVTYWLGLSGRAGTFIQGMICSEDVIYFISVIAFFLALTIIKLRGETARCTGRMTALSYAAAAALLFAVAFVSSRPALKGYLDTTRTKYCTLTEESQEVMKNLDGPMTITTYVNLLGNSLHDGLPKNYMRDTDRFSRYTRFKPEIKMKYVYYWHPSESNPVNSKAFTGLTDKEKAEKMAHIQKVRFDRFLAPEQLGELEEKLGLETEDYRFIRVIEGGPYGRTAKLRMYDDQEKHPGEMEITAAMKTLYAGQPKVGVLAGHGERDVFNIGERGYFTFASSYVFRHALVNQGFDVSVISVAEEEIPEDIDILLIADPQEEMSAEELERIEKYIDKGGNLLLAGKPYNRERLTPLMEHIGVRFMDGILVQQTEDYAQNLIVGDIAPEALKVGKGFRTYILQGNKVTGPDAMAIDASGAGEKGFEVIDIITTDSLANDSRPVWNELQVTDFIEEKAAFNPETGERRLSGVPVATALRREKGGKEQRIIVLGNADMIANSELMQQRSGIRAANYSLISESFRYLSRDQFPIYAPRPAGPDNDLLYLKRSARVWIKWVFTLVIPGLVALLGIFLLIRRKSR
ncbi:MAG: Gldg family protein [Bacteroidales bacterium]|nr:Gldg family protein [Bacteroidales bacterium]